MPDRLPPLVHLGSHAGVDDDGLIPEYE
jgi:hypothetical protein